MRVLAWLSWASLALAVVLTMTALLSQWAINAESFGARDAGLALYLSFVVALALFAALYAAPVAVAIGIVSLLFLERRTGLRFVAAGAVAALPFALLR
jgi:hypothetical protein